MIDYGLVEAIAEKLMRERKAHLYREKGWIFGHGKRVATGVITLRKMITEEETQDDALRVAALFHDVGKGIEPHDRYGMAITREALRDVLAPELLDTVLFYVAAHKTRDEDDLHAQLLQDADILDHFGALEIGMTFQYAAISEEGIGAVYKWYEEEFPPYVERTFARLHFDVSRAVFREKVAFSNAFYARLQVEASGGYMT